ncbi:hypothetical protein MBLNU230_g5082t1 [Neophaeotheca triangularis]
MAASRKDGTSKMNTLLHDQQSKSKPTARAWPKNTTEGKRIAKRAPNTSAPSARATAQRMASAFARASSPTTPSYTTVIPPQGPWYNAPMGHDFENASRYIKVTRPNSSAQSEDNVDLLGQAPSEAQEEAVQGEEDFSFFSQNLVTSEVPVGHEDFDHFLAGLLAEDFSSPVTQSQGPQSAVLMPSASTPAAVAAASIPPTANPVPVTSFPATQLPTGGASAPGAHASTPTPVVPAMPSPNNDGSLNLPLWNKNVPITVSEKQAAKAYADAIATNTDPNKAYGAFDRNVASSTVRLAPGFVALDEELLTFLPGHVKIPAFALHLQQHGWTRGAIAKKILSVRGQLTTREELRTAENRIQNQLKEGYNTFFGIKSYTAVRARSAITPFVNATVDDWHLRDEYSNDSLKARAARSSYQDCYLVDLAFGVNTFPTGVQAGILTQCVRLAFSYNRNYKMSDIPYMIVKHRLSMPQLPVSGDPNADAAADAIAIANPPAAGNGVVAAPSAPAAGPRPKGNYKHGRYSA